MRKRLTTYGPQGSNRVEIYLGNQGAPLPQTTEQAAVTVPVLQQLVGKKMTNAALALVSTLRPVRVRILADTDTVDGRWSEGRVTIVINDNTDEIVDITQDCYIDLGGIGNLALVQETVGDGVFR